MELNQNQESRWLDPGALMKLKSLELQVKVVVEGFLLGLHRSPFHGFSAEFSEYRPYVDGEDTRYLDWKLYARTDRNYIKKFREETNVRTYFLLDQSRSMAFESTGYEKLDYARVLIGSLGYFLMRQRDAVGVCRFDNEIHDFLPPRIRTGHLRNFLKVLHAAQPGTATELSGALMKLGRLMKHRSVVVLVSDFLGDLDGLENELAMLRARGNDISLIQILDPAEISWGQEGNFMVRDMESGREIFVNGQEARQGYQSKLILHQGRLAQMCATQGARLCQVSTAGPLDQFCHHFIKAHGTGWLCGTPEVFALEENSREGEE
jgi:uncharacterized protein (DUF58 family)